MSQGCPHLLDYVHQDTSVSMLPGQTNLLIMTTSHLVTVYALLTLLEESVRRDFSVLKDPTSPLPVLGAISVKEKGKIVSLQSVMLAGFVPVVQRSRSRLMASLETFVQRVNIAPGVLKSLSSALRERFPIIPETATKTTVLPALKDPIVKPKD